MPKKATSSDKDELRRMILGVRSVLDGLASGGTALRFARKEGLNSLQQRLETEQEESYQTVGLLAERAIQKAIEAYGINSSYARSIRFRTDGYVPTNPQFAPANTCDEYGAVKISVSAFRLSPGWLGSTIGHEVEVHARCHTGRNWSKEPHTNAAHEAQAYEWEVKHADIFELTEEEKAQVLSSYREELAKSKA
jgi:hypothetical protein